MDYCVPVPQGPEYVAYMHELGLEIWVTVLLVIITLVDVIMYLSLEPTIYCTSACSLLPFTEGPYSPEAQKS
jgi:hypothetical protein